MKFISQGDINFQPYTKEVKGKKIDHNGTFAVAEGEVTGHKHEVCVKEREDMEIYQQEDGQYILVLHKDATLKHPDHYTPNKTRPQVLPAGTYRTDLEEEYDWFQQTNRKVID